MKALNCILVLIVCLLAGIIGHDAFRSPSRSVARVDVMVLDESLDQFALAWQKEVARRFPDAEVVLCHGGEFVDGQWLVKATYLNLPCMSADDLAKKVKEKFPGKVIVLLACNPGHLHLHVHGVYHAMESVWCVPDRATGDNVMADRMLIDKREHPATIPTTVPYHDRHAYGEDDPDAGSAPQPSRWQQDPGAVGSIFEFIQD